MTTLRSEKAVTITTIRMDLSLQVCNGQRQGTILGLQENNIDGEHGSTTDSPYHQSFTVCLSGDAWHTASEARI